MDSPGVPTIEAYSFGSIRIDGHTYTSDVTVSPDGVANWWRMEGHLLQAADIAVLLERNPNVLIVGTGFNGIMRIAPDVEQVCKRSGVRLIARPTPKAWKLYNNLCGGDNQVVVAALHLTC